MRRRAWIHFNFLATLAYALPEQITVARPAPEQEQLPDSRARMLGLLWGGLIGDALGGPLEFSDRPASEKNLTDARSWGDEDRLTPERLAQLHRIPLHGYEQLRPEPAAYGPWRKAAPAGTLTDDSRHKIVLMQALRTAHRAQRPVTTEDLAQAFLDFAPNGPSVPIEWKALNEEGFREYRYAARWILGERDLRLARPVERLWAGINNCSGQMLLPILAARFPGQPEQAYRAAFALDFIDAPQARDMAAALVAGLSQVLSPELDNVSAADKWKACWQAVRNTDPFGVAQVPFAGRPWTRWLDRAEEWARRAEGRPQVLYEILETEGQAVYWWDAHFTLLAPLSMLLLCDYDPLAALHLTLDFGHDTDSYAQLLGCFIGAVHGIQIFPSSMVDAVRETLHDDYAEDVNEWLDVLTAG